MWNTIYRNRDCKCSDYELDGLGHIDHGHSHTGIEIYRYISDYGFGCMGIKDTWLVGIRIADIQIMGIWIEDILVSMAYGHRCESDRRNVGQDRRREGTRTGRMQERGTDRTIEGQGRCMTGRMQDRTDAGQDRCRTGRMQDRMDAGTGRMQEQDGWRIGRIAGQDV